MYETGELVVYGTTGVCQVEGVIYTPVDSHKVPIRPVMSREDAEALIGQIPKIHAEAWKAPTLQALTQKYQAAMQSSDSRDLVALTMSIYAKRTEAASRKRRLGMVDERYMKQAERLLYGELSAALEIPFEDVGAYIAARVEKHSDKRGKSAAGSDKRDKSGTGRREKSAMNTADAERI